MDPLPVYLFSLLCKRFFFLDFLFVASSFTKSHELYTTRCQNHSSSGSLTSLQMLLGSDEKEKSKSSCHLENKQSVPWREKLSQSTKEWPGKLRFTEITRKLMASWRQQSSRLHYSELNFLFIQGISMCRCLLCTRWCVRCWMHLSCMATLE